MFDEIDIQIIDLLMSKSEEIITSKQLSFFLDLSSKTVQKKIKSLEEPLNENGAQLLIKKGKGVQLIIEDEQVFEKFKNEIHKRVTSENLFNQLVLSFVEDERYIKVEDLQEKLYLSKGKLTSLLNQLREVLSFYELNLESKPHHGLKIEGTEFYKRRFLASSYVQNALGVENNSLSSGKYQKIKKLILNVTQKYNYPIAENTLENLSTHLSIAMERVKSDYTLQIQFDVIDELSIKIEGNIVEDIFWELENEFDAILPEAEKHYFALHFFGKRVLSDDDYSNVSSQINQLTELILERIKKTTKIDLLHDLDLRAMLALHLEPMKVRLETGLDLKNPLLEEIKSKCIIGFDLGILAAKQISEFLGTRSISDDEISYLALHFAAALERRMKHIKKKRILVLCPSGRASAQMLKTKFERYFSDYIGNIVVCDINEAEGWLEKENFHFVLSTVPIHKKFSLPIFNFEFFLEKSDREHILRLLVEDTIRFQSIADIFLDDLFFVDVDLSSRNDILDFMLSKIEEHQNVPKEFSQLIWERENFSGTDFMEVVAIPHPMTLVSKETFGSVLIPKKPVFWERKKVSLVLLISISQADSTKYAKLFEWLATAFSSKEDVNKIVKSKSHADFLECLLKMNK